MNARSIARAEWTLGILLTAAVLALLVVRATHAGGLWRDEAAAVQLARMPTLGDVVANFQYEAFPLLFPLTLRAYTDLVGTSNAAFRAFGLAVGCLLVAVLWLNARLLQRGPPLLALVLLGLNTTVLTWATTIRGYGLGVALILLVFGLVASLLVEPTRLRWVAALLAALAAVHCLLYNSILLAAIAGSASLVALARRRTGLAAALLALGALCAASLVPYVGPYSAGREWDALLLFRVDVGWLWKQLCSALGAPWPALAWAWHVVLATVSGAAVWRLWKGRGQPAPEADRLALALLAMAASVAGYVAFLKFLGYVTHAWYYLALMAVLASGLDLLAAELAHLRWVRVARLGLAALALVALPFAAWPKVTLRQSNVDLVAAALEREAKADDLIVVTPWSHGITFNWYYRGTTPWQTLPTIHEHRTHRYDLLKKKMMATDPIDDVRARVAGTLQAGGRVWLVGDYYVPRPGTVPQALPPAPSPLFGWSGAAYELSWAQQMNVFLHRHVVKGEMVDLTGGARVNDYENVKVVRGEGWH
jgi:hypothetical protein